MKRCAAVAVMLAAACGAGSRERKGEAPVARVTMDGSEEAFVDLVDGVSARELVGSDLFVGLRPGLSPAEAASALGPPTRTETEGDTTLVFYERAGHRAAIASRFIAPSGGGPRTLAHDVRAFPPAGFVETLPKSLRELVRGEPALRRIVLVSKAPEDWHIRLMVQDGRMEYVAASAHMLSPRAVSSGPRIDAGDRSSSR